MAKNPHYLSQLAYVELLSTNLAETVRFYTEIVGMDVSYNELIKAKETIIFAA